MHGGYRKGAGRNRLPENQKRHAKSIYLTEDNINLINELKLEGCTSFSQKCNELIARGLKEIKSKSDEKDYPIIYENNEYYNDERQCEGVLKFIDLFAGIGGIRKAFEDESTKCVFSSEWDKFAQKTYEANFGEIPSGDITKIDENDIPDHDILLAGFPCQPFSNIGKREGFEHETQGTLFFDVLRILKGKEPKMFLLENVKGLLNNDNGRTFKIILESLYALGYSVFYKVLNAKDFGLPQNRERVIIVGFHSSLDIKQFEFPKGDENHRVPIKDILEHDPKGYSISKHLQENYLFKKDDGHPQIVDFDSEIQVKTLVSTYHKIQRLTGTFVKDGETGLRLFSELESKRLMGFPDDFKIPVSRTQMYRQFGNSVAIPMIKAVANSMKKIYKDIDQGIATEREQLSEEVVYQQQLLFS